jgi:hypothetical protein
MQPRSLVVGLAALTLLCAAAPAYGASVGAGKSSVQITARDALFGFPIDASVSIAYPDGRTKRVQLGADGRVVVEGLGAGSYSLAADGPGFFVGGFELSRGARVAALRLVSYVDIGLGAGALGLLAGVAWVGARRRRGALIMVGRPATRSFRPRLPASWSKPRWRSPSLPGPAPKLDLSRLRSRFERSGADNRRYVVVHMDDGRRIEGWSDPTGGEDDGFIRLATARVFDPDGNEQPSSPTDHFIPVSRIQETERSDGPSSDTHVRVIDLTERTNKGA